MDGGGGGGRGEGKGGGEGGRGKRENLKYINVRNIISRVVHKLAYSTIATSEIPILVVLGMRTVVYSPSMSRIKE